MAERNRDGFQDVRDQDGWLLFRLDASRAVIEIKPHKRPLVSVDLVRFGLRPPPNLDKSE